MKIYAKQVTYDVQESPLWLSDEFFEDVVFGVNVTDVVLYEFDDYTQTPKYKEV